MFPERDGQVVYPYGAGRNLTISSLSFNKYLHAIAIFFT